MDRSASGFRAVSLTIIYAATTQILIGLVAVLSLLGAATLAADSGIVTVNSTTDWLDGDTSSIVNLIAAPGPDGVVSLREAILAANNDGGGMIEFAIPLADPGYGASGIVGTWTIALSETLPVLSSGQIVISGTTQLLNIDAGTSPPGPPVELNGEQIEDGNCLKIMSDSNVLHGLVINRCPGTGISVEGSQNTVTGNYIGTDVTGGQALGNGVHGIHLDYAAHSTIGGTRAGQRNVISGNDGNGLFLDRGSDGNIIAGNYIGTDASGSLDLGNSGTGVRIVPYSSENRIVQLNVISGNDGNGISIGGQGTEGNVISGNYIGLDAGGESALGNAWDGVSLWSGTSGTVIGGDAAGEGNVISGNGGNGVGIWGMAHGNFVRWNLIGTDASGTQDVGNGGSGVLLDLEPGSNTIGPENVIAFNSGNGVTTCLLHPGGQGNIITRNSIHSNVGSGINHGGGSAVAAPNVSWASGTIISGTAPAGTTVEVFTGPDDEGKTYLISTAVDAAGTWSCSGTFTLDWFVTATAIDAQGTSEFSAAKYSGLPRAFLPLVYSDY